VKKIKLVSVLVIIVSVVTVGIFMGKQMFAYLESRAAPPAAPAGAPTNQGLLSTVEAAPAQGTSQVLYTAQGTEPLPLTSVSNASPAKSGGPLPATNPDKGLPSSSSPTGPLSAAAASKVPLVAFANGNGINVRDQPTLDSKVIMKIGNGTRGHVLEQKDGWTKVKWDFNKKIGWTRDDLLIIGPKDTLTGLPTTSAASGTAAPAPGPGGKMAIGTEAKAGAKAPAVLQTVSVAMAKPVPPDQTVKGFASLDKLPSEGTICSDAGAKVRDAPSTKAALLGRIPKGVVVKIKSCKKIGKYHWFQISYHQGRKEGWTREDNLQF
jgi:uncharacterized protein YgiM (DUF1202 family)